MRKVLGSGRDGLPATRGGGLGQRSERPSYKSERELIGKARTLLTAA
jgi:hypothetical protein